MLLTGVGFDEELEDLSQTQRNEVRSGIWFSLLSADDLCMLSELALIRTASDTAKVSRLLTETFTCCWDEQLGHFQF